MQYIFSYEAFVKKKVKIFITYLNRLYKFVLYYFNLNVFK